MLNKELLAILACPICKGDVVVLGNEEGLFCPACDVVFPIRDEIPVMLIEEAIKKADWDAGKRVNTAKA